MALDYQRVIDWLDDRIVERPGRIVAAFLLATAVFAAAAASTAAVTTAYGVTLMAPSASRSPITPRGVGRR